MSANTSTSQTIADGFSVEKRAAVQERAAEPKKQASRGPGNKAVAEEFDVSAKIAGMHAPDRAVAERIHAIVTTAPDLSPKL